MAIYSIRVCCNDVTPGEILTEYISALDFAVAMRQGLAHFEDRELESFSCEEIDIKTLRLRLVSAVLNDSENDSSAPSEALEIGSVLMQEINNLKSQLTAMEENHDCALDKADEDKYGDIYELGYRDGVNGLNARDTINPKLQHIYDCGFIDGQNNTDEEVSEDNNSYDRAFREGYFDGLNGRDKRQYSNPAHQFVYNQGYLNGQNNARSKWY
nr:MAG TPA: hypothetical protein [Caudoviricetes sp.]